MLAPELQDHVTDVEDQGMKAQPHIGEAAETLPIEDLRRLQLNRLRVGLKRVEASVPFYREALAHAGVSADRIRSLNDLALLPFTTKQDLRDHSITPSVCSPCP